jgi:hypothetical protein
MHVEATLSMDKCAAYIVVIVAPKVVPGCQRCDGGSRHRSLPLYSSSRRRRSATAVDDHLSTPTGGRHVVAESARVR